LQKVSNTFSVLICFLLYFIKLLLFLLLLSFQYGKQSLNPFMRWQLVGLLPLVWLLPLIVAHIRSSLPSEKIILIFVFYSTTVLL
jgi:hypothetical protein